eukprot:Sdes_comp22931_c0_seq1m21297
MTMKVALEELCDTSTESLVSQNFPKAHRKLSERESFDHSKRKSCPLVRGLPKKGGAGGKGTWGKAGEEIFSVPDMDKGDPNYDEVDRLEDFILEELSPPLSFEEFCHMVEPLFLEYFDNGDIQELRQGIEDLQCSFDMAFVIMFGFNLAVERKNADKELISLMISNLYSSDEWTLSVKEAFTRIFSCLSDMKLDCPNIVEVTAKFIARAVADDSLPPCFVKKNLDHIYPCAREAIRLADQMLNVKHGYSRLDQVWGHGGGRRAVAMLTKNMKMILEEYLSSEDIPEVERGIGEMDVPHFHHWLVFESIYMALSTNRDREVLLLSKLLSRLYECGIVTKDQMFAGFSTMVESIPDIRLDIPNAASLFDNFLRLSYENGYLSHTFKAPSVQRKRLVSHGDGGEIKF